MPLEPTMARLAAYLAAGDAPPDPVRANLLIAQAEYTDLEPAQYLRQLDEWAARLRARLRPDWQGERHLAALDHLLFDELGFSGNEADYYDPRNSYLNEVIDRRLGLPITLSLVYVAVGRRAGLPLVGVGLPGHFIVRCAGPEGEILVDPYHQGARLTVEDCRRRLRQLYGQAMTLRPEHLRTTPPRQIVMRMLANLKMAYLRSNDLERALRSIELLLVVAPRAPQELRDRGLIRARLGALRQAVADLEAYLSAAPQASDAERIRAERDWLLKLEAMKN